MAVDYAHTPDALDKALQALRPLAAQRGGRLWCVFGCGGDRDAAKRPLMAAVAEKNADRVVVTSDNPRSEKPEAIISQILLGLSHHAVRAGAGRPRRWPSPRRIAAADAADVVLLAGKGHEDYQEIAGVQACRSPTRRMPQPRCAADGQARRHGAPHDVTLQQARAWLPGAHAGRRRPRTPSRACTPTPARCSRATCSSRCSGERFDANDFLAEAPGAAAPPPRWRSRGRMPAGLPGIEVDDTQAGAGPAGRRAGARSSACR